MKPARTFPISNQLTKSSTLRLTGAALLFCGLTVGCGPKEEDAQIDLDPSASFIVVPRTVSAETQSLRKNALHTAGVIDQDGVGNDFYLAINRKDLGTASKWFLSSYLKQYFPGAVAGGAARSMGTRVVSFQAQDSRVIVFDTDNRKASSDVFSPDVLVDAYPVVSYAPFDRLPGSAAFVLFDPAAGQNDFAVFGDAWAGGSEPVHFSVNLSYLSSYRSITDGITYEQTFSGYADLPINNDPVETNDFRASGTMGIGIRRYSETTGYVQPPIVQGDGQDVYFRSDPALVKNEGDYTQASIKWGDPKTKPVQWVVSNVVDTLQADPEYKDYDIYGAFAKGVTNWNSVFGYEALQVRKGTSDDSFANDDTNMIIVDTDPSYGAAFANWRTNPNSGEIRGASVYINSIWLEIADILFSDDPIKKATLGTMKKPTAPVIFWRPMGQHSDGCLKWAPIYEGVRGPKGDVDKTPDGMRSPELTKKQKVEQYLTHVVLHEIGHTLGLRHNFKGSLKFDPPHGIYSSSVMEYIDDNDAIYCSMPQSYDIDAVKFLYGLSMTLPSDQFCNDDGESFDPDCTPYDRTNDPYTTATLANYVPVLQDFLDGVSTVAPNNTLNEMFSYVRDGRTAAARLKAWNDTVDQSGGYSMRVGKVDATKLATIPGYGDHVDAEMARVIQRLFVDDASLRGRFTDDPSDPVILEAAMAEAKGMMENADKIRSVATRRMLAGWFKTLQSYEANVSLAKGANELEAEIHAGAFADPKEEALAEDTLAYMTNLLTPYLTGAGYNPDF